ncbi:MAG: ACT domain-containing protein [Gammaproteobacteria bacterium]
MKYIYAISVVTENTMRVLQRLAGIFARQRLNIEQLNVFETSNAGTSLFNIVVHSDEKTMERVINQLQRIFELLEVRVNSKIPLSTTKQSIAA